MTEAAVRHLRRAADSSAVIGRLRPIVEGSLLCRAIAWIIKGSSQLRARILVGLGGPWTDADEAASARRLRAIFATSRLVATLSFIGTFVEGSWRGGAARRMLVGPFLSADLVDRVRMLAIVLISAVATHVILAVLIGLEVGTIGWSVRGAFIFIAAAALLKSEGLAAAWRDRLR